MVKAQAEYARQKYMHERDAASKADYQNAQQALTAAQADLKVADALINQYDVRAKTAQANVGYTRIVSPTAGTVVAMVADEGLTFIAKRPAPSIAHVPHPANIPFQAQISEADVPRVHPGMPAYFTILGEPDHKYPAMLSKIEPGPIDMKTYDGTANSSTAATAVYYNGLLNASNPDGKLRIEMTAQVSIVLSQARNALLIPSGALIQRSASKRSASAASGTSATNTAAASAAPAAASASEPASAAPDTAAQPAPASSASDSPGRGRLYMVRVAKGEKGKETIEERQVRIGLNNRVQAQVLEGLQEGERVVIGDASGAKAGSTRMPGVRMF